MDNSNKLIIHLAVDAQEIQEILDFLMESGISIDSISTKQLYDQLNYVGRGYKC